MSFSVDVSVFVEGVPKAQPRARAVVTKNGRARMYDPGTAQSWRDRISLALRPHAPKSPSDLPFALALTFFLPRPKSHYLRGAVRSTAPTYVTSKPDIDNLVKALADECTQLGFWRDDAQLVSLTTEKRYAAGSPGLAIGIVTLEEAKSA